MKKKKKVITRKRVIKRQNKKEEQDPIRKGQAAMEVLIIIGVMVVGVIVFGTFYFSNIGEKVNSTAGGSGDSNITDNLEKSYDRSILNDTVDQAGMAGGITRTGGGGSGSGDTDPGTGDGLDCSTCSCTDSECNLNCSKCNTAGDLCSTITNPSLCTNENHCACEAVCIQNTTFWNTYCAAPTCIEDGGCDETSGENNDNCDVDCYCGNNNCESYETSDTCPTDCLTYTCGNNVCEGTLGENLTNCPYDCGTGPVCGDNFCDSFRGETLITCSADCNGSSPPLVDICGNGVCEKTENIFNCPKDCQAVFYVLTIESPKMPNNKIFTFVELETPILLQSKIMKSVNGNLMELDPQEKEEIDLKLKNKPIEWYLVNQDNKTLIAKGNGIWFNQLLPQGKSNIVATANLDVQFETKVNIEQFGNSDNRIFKGGTISGMPILPEPEKEIFYKDLSKLSFSMPVNLGEHIVSIKQCNWYIKNVDTGKEGLLFSGSDCRLFKFANLNQDQKELLGIGKNILFVQAIAVTNDDQDITDTKMTTLYILK